MISALPGLARLRRKTESFGLGQRGGMLIEFAFALPILVTLTLGTVNTAIYILLHQRMDRAASSVADLVSQPEDITEAHVMLSFDAADHLFGDLFDLDSNGHIIVTSVQGQPDNNPPLINFQVHKREQIGACPPSNYASAVGTTAGDEASLPNGLTLEMGESVIVAEVFFEYEPMFFGDLIKGGTQYHVSVRRPRLGSGVLAGGQACETESPG